MHFGSMSDMIFIFLLALILFGPKRLPQIGRQIGKALNDFKRASNEFKFQLEDEIRQLEVTGKIPSGQAAPPAGADQAPENSIARGPLTAALPPVEPRTPSEPPPAEASAVAAVPEIAVPEMTAAESAMHADLAGTLPSSQAAEPSAAAAAATSSSSSAGSNG